MRQIIEPVLAQASEASLACALLDSYSNIEENFSLGKWKISELDAGHFVEASRRFIEHKLLGHSCDLSSKLKIFNGVILTKYENAKGDESYRLLIPRALYSIYGIRNKRGVGHLAGISANEMDASYILHTCKWVLAELVRLNSAHSADETQVIINKITERTIEMVYSDGGITRVLNPKLSARSQILILLLKCSPQLSENLCKVIEYKNKARFKDILNKLHSERKIEFKSDGSVTLLPPGMIEAESLLLDSG